jgi:DNA polymerase elongation subunit (family B)
MYKKAFARRLRDNKFLIHLWEDEGYSKIEWDNQAYIECNEAEAKYKGLNGEPLKKVRNYNKDNPKLHFHDMPPYQKFLVEKYGINDTPSTTHRELFFDIECEMLDDMSEEGLKKANKKITSIAWYDKQVDEWGIVILDEKNHFGSNIKTKSNKKIIPCRNEGELLAKFLEIFRDIDPDIIVGWNSDYF